jgi:hypothetical protein
MGDSVSVAESGANEGAGGTRYRANGFFLEPDRPDSRTDEGARGTPQQAAPVLPQMDPQDRPRSRTTAAALLILLCVLWIALLLFSNRCERPDPNQRVRRISDQRVFSHSPPESGNNPSGP